MRPQRIQLRRTKGYRKPAGAVVVTRPTRWGNPFRVGEMVDRASDLRPYMTTPLDSEGLRNAVDRCDWVKVTSAAQAVELHGWWLLEQPDLMASLGELHGHDLACWCPLVDSAGMRVPCHADLLLSLANDAGPA